MFSRRKGYPFEHHQVLLKLFAVSIVDLSEMTENGETEVTLPVEMADTEMHLLNNFIKRSAFFEIIKKRKSNIENELADLKKVQYLSQESNRPPFIFYLGVS
jgi:hypothetical protein